MTIKEEDVRAENQALTELAGQKYLSLESYRKNWEAVRTPVWFIENQGAIYVRTDSDTGKAKRIRRNPLVRIVACNARGTPKGAWVDARAEFATAEETEQATKLLKEKYGLQYRAVRFFGRLQGRRNKALVLAIKA